MFEMKESDCWIIEQNSGVLNNLTKAIVRMDTNKKIDRYKQELSVATQKESSKRVEDCLLGIPVCILLKASL